MYKKRIKRILIIKEIERLLEQAKQYHENNKKRLKVQVRNTNRELSNKEKNIKREYGRNGYQNMSEEGKQKLTEYQKKSSQSKKKINIKSFIYFSSYSIKMEEKILIFGKEGIKKIYFINSNI